MNSKIKKELKFIFIALLPLFYLLFIWNELPEQVPIHWNIEGEADSYGDKWALALIALSMPLLTYLVFLIVPLIDPKGKIKKMGDKYSQLKFMVVLFMSVLSIYLIHISSAQIMVRPQLITVLVGVLYIILGNYFKTIKANYFIGIRTPWTLESETVWNKTHRLGGVLWLIGGLLIVIGSLVTGPKISFIILFVITAIITLVPVVYSYLKFKELAK